MEYENIKNILENTYEIKVDKIEKVKGSYKILCTNEEYCLKVIKYTYPHFYFITSAIEHLQHRGFEYIPKLIITKDNKNYICLKERYAYLTPWIKSRQSDYSNMEDLKKVSMKLAELHNCSEGFCVNRNMNPRVGWFSWPKSFDDKGREILDFKKRINQKMKKSDFDLLYMSIMDEELERIEKSLNNLNNSKYINVMNKSVLKKGFCHHDYAHHNILIDEKEQVNIIDFDYCILDSNIHDLGSLCIRVMKEGGWSIDKFKYILENYSVKKSVEQDEIPILSTFIGFPQLYWQIGIQYYWEQPLKEESVFIKRLTKYINDRKMREEFVNELRYLKWR